jgi:virulence-associated protein VapD
MKTSSNDGHDIGENNWEKSYEDIRACMQRYNSKSSVFS